jgi:phosphohistidine phosphatase
MRGGAPEYLLITSHKGNWIFPKGIIDPGETAEETALKESREEAGIHGRITGPPIGSYTYEKWNSECEVTVFLLEVQSEDPAWLEGEERQRAWFRIEDARAVIKSKKIARMLERAHEALKT